MAVLRTECQSARACQVDALEGGPNGPPFLYGEVHTHAFNDVILLTSVLRERFGKRECRNRANSLIVTNCNNI